MLTIYTIGHSNHPLERFLDLLRMHCVAAVADVRSLPYSRFSPQFNKENLGRALAANQMSYFFLGNLLGARPNDPHCFAGGTVDFSRLCTMDYFQEGLEHVREAAARMNLAILCSEKDPIECHRMILVCRHLRGPGTVIRHIHENGALEDNGDAEMRLMESLHIAPDDLFMSREERIEEAYDRQGERIAFHYNEEYRTEIEFVAP